MPTNPAHRECRIRLYASAPHHCGSKGIRSSDPKTSGGIARAGGTVRYRTRTRRKEGETWVPRFRVANGEGKRVEHTLPVGLVAKFPKESDAWARWVRPQLVARIEFLEWTPRTICGIPSSRGCERKRTHA